MLKKVFTLLLILGSTDVIAAGNGSVTDLIYPFINVALLFGFLFWKLKKPVSNMFNENADKVKELAELASKKDEEAETQLKELETKMAAVQGEMENIVVNAKEDGERFCKDHTNETQEQIERVKQDAEMKLNSEKAELIREINSKLLDEVINGAKDKLKTDGDLQKKATTNMMSRI